MKCRAKVSNSPHRWPFSNLHGKFVYEISKKLKSREDILTFRRVCRKWSRRSLVLPQELISYNLPLPKTIHASSKTIPFYKSPSPVVLQVSSIYLLTPNRREKTDRQPPFAELKPWLIMAVESTRGKITVRHALTGKRVRKFPPSLDMNQFHVSKLTQELNFKSSKCVYKVVNCSSSLDSIEVLVLYDQGVLGKLSLEWPESKVLYGYGETDVSDYKWERFELRKGLRYWCRFLDDIVSFKEMNCAVDRLGRLYMLDFRSLILATTLISEPVCRGDQPCARRKRLVIDPATGELLLVIRENVSAYVKQVTRFKVYKFNQQGKSWEVVESIGNDRILFVGIDHFFFANTQDFPGCIDGNSIVFASNCFIPYNGRNGRDKTLFDDEEVNVGLYRFGEGDNFTLLSSDYPEFAKTIWPPPKWFSTKSEEETDEDSSGSLHSSDKVSDSTYLSLSSGHLEGLLTDSSDDSISDNKDEDSDVEMISGSCGDDDDSDKNEEEEEEGVEETQSECSGVALGSKTTNRSDSMKDNVEAETNSPFEQHACDINFSDNSSPASTEHVAQENHSDLPSTFVPPSSLGCEGGISGTVQKDEQTRGKGPKFAEEKVSNGNSIPVTPLVPRARSTVEFQGAVVRSELIPTLDTIVAKHGNLIDENTVRSKKMLASALEVLAELVITLQNTTGRTLTENQANDMRWNLSDILRAGLKVDWLEPVIEKATRLQKSKPYIEYIADLEKKKAEIDEEEKKYLARNAKVKQEIEEDIACLSTRIPFPNIEVIDLDDCLGQGI